MRTFVLICALAALLAVPAAAQDVAPPPIPQLVGSVFPAAGGTDKRPIDTTVKFATTVNKEAGAAVKRIVWTIPRAVTVSSRGFQRCAVPDARRGKCSPRSFVGSGRLSLYLGRSVKRDDYELTVYANGPHRLTFAFTGDDGLVVAPAGLFGQRIKLPIPALLRLTPSDRPAFLTNFELALGPAQARGRSFAALGACHGAPHRFRADFLLTPPENPTKTTAATATAVSPCRNP